MSEDLIRMLTSLSDNELVAAFLTERGSRGSEDAAAEIMSRHWEPLVDSLTRRLHGDRDGAEDVAQQAFMNLFKFADKFDPGRHSLTCFIMYLAKDKCIDEFRRKKKQPKTYGNCEDRGGHHADQEVGRFAEFFSQLSGSDDSPEEAAIRKESVEKFWDYVENLDDENRQIVVLMFAEGRSCYQIAEIMGIDRKTVPRRVKRILPALRAAIGYDFDPPVQPASAPSAKKSDILAA